MSCPRCNGTGKVERTTYNGSPPSQWRKSGNSRPSSYSTHEYWCSICDGTGNARFLKSEYPTCTHCNGNGTISYDKPQYTEYSSGRIKRNGSKQVTEQCDYCNGRGKEKDIKHYYEPVYDKPSGSGGGCFITTSVCSTLNLEDNNHILNTFRNFRDSWVLNQEEGEKIISTYYLESPKIVKRIEGDKEIHKYIWENYLQHSYIEILNENYQIAFSIYQDMFYFLKK